MDSDEDDPAVPTQPLPPRPVRTPTPPPPPPSAEVVIHASPLPADAMDFVLNSAMKNKAKDMLTGVIYCNMTVKDVKGDIYTKSFFAVSNVLYMFNFNRSVQNRGAESQCLTCQSYTGYFSYVNPELHKNDDVVLCPCAHSTRFTCTGECKRCMDVEIHGVLNRDDMEMFMACMMHLFKCITIAARVTAGGLMSTEVIEMINNLCLNMEGVIVWDERSAAILMECITKWLKPNIITQMKDKIAVQALHRVLCCLHGLIKCVLPDVCPNYNDLFRLSGAVRALVMPPPASGILRL